jgi:hypothetical protein
MPCWKSLRTELFFISFSPSLSLSQVSAYCDLHMIQMPPPGAHELETWLPDGDLVEPVSGGPRARSLGHWGTVFGRD